MTVNGPMQSCTNLTGKRGRFAEYLRLYATGDIAALFGGDEIDVVGRRVVGAPVALAGTQHDRGVWRMLAYLRTLYEIYVLFPFKTHLDHPLLDNVGERVGLIDGVADDDTVGVDVAHASQLLVVLLPRRVPYADLELIVDDSLAEQLVIEIATHCFAIDRNLLCVGVEYSWHVGRHKCIVVYSQQQRRLSCCAITHNDNLLVDDTPLSRL